MNEPFLYQVVDTVVHENECQYPELREKQSYITRVIRTEEENFAKTIDGGMKIFSEMLESHKAKGETTFSGADAFKLYDTYGFPIDLTNEMVAEEGMQVDEAAFKQLMQEQKVRAREARKALGDLGWAGVEFGKEIPATTFIGYTNMEAEGKIVAIVADEELQGAITSGTDAIPCPRPDSVLRRDGRPGRRPWHHSHRNRRIHRHRRAEEQGRQVHALRQARLRLSGRRRYRDRLHRRNAPQGHHARPLRNASAGLRSAHRPRRSCASAGSLVEPDRLRYDFTHFSAVTADELVKISRLVSELVLDGMSVETKEMPIAEAKKLGAIALFGEKYGDVVRVVNMGGKSIELCGGTHVDNTAKVGPFRITSESSVASGVRRIEAVTGEAFLNLVDEMNMRLVKAAELLKTTPMELINKAQSSMNEIRELHQTIERMKDKLFAGDVDSLLFSAKDVNGLKVVTASRENTDANDLRKLGDFLRDKNPNTVAALGAVNGEKVTLLAVCGKNAVARGIKAGDIIKNIAPIVGGKGGGKPDSAMGGGTNALKLDDALAAVDDYVAANVKD